MPNIEYNGTLLIDYKYNWHRNCQTICILATYNMIITRLGLSIFCSYSFYIGKKFTN